MAKLAEFVIPTALRRHPKAGTMQKLLAQIMKFGVVGVIATVIDFGIMNLLHYGLGLNILIANTYLDGSYSVISPNISLDAQVMQKMFKQSPFPCGVPSH